MLATLTDRRFSDEDWVFEPKLDGVRCLCFRQGNNVELYSRNRILVNNNYPEIVEAMLRQKPSDFIVDGEIVAFKDDKSSFSQLQNRMKITDPDQARATGVEVFYYLFDIIYWNGRDTTHLDLLSRKKLLEGLFSFKPPIHFTRHLAKEGEVYYEQACKMGWEGLVAKKIDSPYLSTRSPYWLKLKCTRQQEFVIGGYTAPQGSRENFGALLIGYYNAKNLIYSGKVGTGYSDIVLSDLGRKLASLECDESPFVEYTLSRKGVHWVKPRLVAQVEFTEWTIDGRLRHPRFLGLRYDKPATQVVREPIR